MTETKPISNSGINPTAIPTVTPTTQADAAVSNQTEGAKNAANSSGTLGEQEFLTLLVNQLQNQDPLNPMDSQEFAVQLAQFSQVEQLISINNKLDAQSSGAGSVGSMASFLGTEVVIRDQGGEFLDGKGPNLYLDVPTGVQSARVDVVDSAGQVVASADLGQLEAGKQIVSLNNLGVADGKYDLRVVAVDEVGRFKEITPKVTGTVDGFVIEPEPKLLVGGKEVGLDEIVEVYRGA